ncbi:MAG TPA: histone deacetylase [Thermodesulfobacteriaceae bacterium]|nr:histone deacetylase [Thermodesulfobacteriaceae bacterium]
MSTLIIRDMQYLDHDPGPGHPESPERLKTIYKRLDREDVAGLFRSMVPRPASREELAWNHSERYIERIARTSGGTHKQLDPDTATSAGSWEAACLAAGGVFTAMDAIVESSARNGFALVRPPGHHAEFDHAMGFCLFNNIALGAHYGIKKLGAERILIVDWDLHHGNGTQNSFYDNPDVLYFSTHQYPYYPGSGSLHQVGRGKGEGFTVNVPMSPSAGDREYGAVFNKILVPVCREYSPDFILVSAGFDTYHHDPLGGMKVTVKGFAYLARILLGLAETCCQGRIVFCLEGGYNLQGLRDGIMAVLYECRGMSILDNEDAAEIGCTEAELLIIDQVKEVQKEYWSL